MLLRRASQLMCCSTIGLATAGLLVGCQARQPDFIDRLLIGEVMANSTLAEDLRALAQPGGRVACTPQAERAEEFIARKASEYGLATVRLEPFDMQSWIVRDTEVTVLGDSPRVLAGAVGLGRTLSTPPDGISAEVLDLEKPDEEDFAARAAEIAGRFVLIRDRSLPRATALRLAVEHGAAGLMVMSPPERAPIIGNGHETPRPEPAVVIPYDEALLERLAGEEPVRVSIRLVTENWTCRPNNIVAEIPGTGDTADEVVILCAHLDAWHLAEGALDNGTGSAAILEAARALARVDWQPRRTVRFIWFMAEELGLLGSRAYVQQHADELDHIVAVVNSDMPGSPRGVVTFGHPELSPFLEDVLAGLRAYDLRHRVSEARGMWSDHAPFMHEGVCTLAVWGDMGPGAKHYHTVGDTYEQVDLRATNEAAAVYAVLVRHLADAPDWPCGRRMPSR